LEWSSWNNQQQRILDEINQDLVQEYKRSGGTETAPQSHQITFEDMAKMLSFMAHKGPVKPFC
jgi:hypothetical protein